MRSPTPSRRSTEALRLAKCFVSDPKTREKLKARQRRNGKAWVADMIDEAIIVSRELIRLLSKSDTPRTDSVLPSQSFIDETRLFDRCYYLPLIEHARQLERELAAPSESTSPASDSYPHPKRGSGEAGSSPSSEIQESGVHHLDQEPLDFDAAVSLLRKCRKDLAAAKRQACTSEHRTTCSFAPSAIEPPTKRERWIKAFIDTCAGPAFPREDIRAEAKHIVDCDGVYAKEAGRDRI